MLYTSPLNPLDCLGEYKHHGRVQSFFAAPEALAGVIPFSESASGKDPSVFKPGAQGLLQPLIDHFSQSGPLDYVLWWGLHYGLPQDLHCIDKPCVLMVSDWHDHYLALKPLLPAFAMIFCDEKLRQKLLQEPHLSQRVFAGAAYSFVPEKVPPPAAERDIDVLFVGGHNPRKYVHRNQFLWQMASLPHQRCVIASDIPQAQYLQLLSRSKIAFNHALRQEMNLRSYEAAACGALLFVEDTNLEVQNILPPEVAYIPYNVQNLNTRLQYYLDNAGQRQAIAQRAQQMIQGFSYTHQFAALLQKIEAFLPHRVKSESFASSRLRYGALANSTTVPALRRDALTALQAQVQPPEASLEALNALLVTTADVTLFLPEPPPVNHALADIQQALSQRLCNHLFKQDTMETQSTVHRWLYLYNLAWSYYFTGEQGAVLQCLSEVASHLPHVDFAQFLEDGQSAFLLPLRYTRLHLLYQEAAYQGAGAFRSCIAAGFAFLQGCCYKAQNDLTRAQQAFELCVQEVPTLAEAYFELAAICVAQQKPLLAEQWLLKGLSQGIFFPQMWRFYFDLLAQRALTLAEIQVAEQLVFTLTRLFTHPKYKPFIIDIQQQIQKFKQRRPQ